MKKKTYLQSSLTKGRLMRWQSMPLKVYIAPMKFYSKQGEDYKYKEMVIRALNTWEQVSLGKVSFNIVSTLLESQINVDWKRVDRQALGHCIFNYDAQNRLYGAEVQIGLTDGLIHKNYDNDSEVFHTILHEIGHAIGLGHSPFDTDIMYTPHRYGVTSLSKTDVLTLRWLYKLPLNATPSEIASKNRIQSNDIDEIVTMLILKNDPSEFEKIKMKVDSERKDLLQEAQNIADLKRYNIALQHIKLPDEMRGIFTNRNKK